MNTMLHDLFNNYVHFSVRQTLQALLIVCDINNNNNLICIAPVVLKRLQWGGLK